jgi:single-stranded DNA-binding protein
MLNALITGTLATDPKAGTSKSGTEWANCVVRVPCGQNRETGDQESAFVQVACFGSEAAKLARLAKGDSLSATGALKPSEYQAKDGTTRHGLSLTATGILTAYQVRAKRGDSDGKAANVKRDLHSGREQSAAYHDFARRATTPVHDDFGDTTIPF